MGLSFCRRELMPLIRRSIQTFFLAIGLFLTVVAVAYTDPDPAASSSGAEAAQPTVEELVRSLPEVKLRNLLDVIAELERIGGEAVLPLLKALLAGDLYYRKDNGQVVIAQQQESTSNYQLSDSITLAPLGVVEKKAIRKVRTNNKVRSELRTIIARLNLFSKQVSVRKAAIAQITDNLDADNIALLKKAKLTEKNGAVLSAINSALMIADLKSDDSAVKLAAISSLENSLEPIVRNRLETILQQESDPIVKNAAAKALRTIESRRTFYSYLETLFFGLSLGSVLLLVAAGLAITFGVMGVINMAHGEMIMLGAYTTYVVQLLLPDNIALSIFIAIPAAFIVSGLFGIMIERGVIQFLKGRPLETLLATFGISLILQQMVRSIFSPLNRQVTTPEFMSGALEINAAFSITYNRLYILLFALLVFALLQLILKKTSLGLQVRAVSQNRDMAKSMGIRTEWVDALTFGLGSGIAGLAGVALSQITNVGPNLGQSYIIDSFMVVVFGGVGNLWGTLVGGFSLGALNKFLEPTTGAVLANIIVLVGIILFIQKRPRGLFPQKGRAAE